LFQQSQKKKSTSQTPSFPLPVFLEMSTTLALLTGGQTQKRKEFTLENFEDLNTPSPERCTPSMKTFSYSNDSSMTEKLKTLFFG
jgi:hypothetical protein